MYNIYGCLCIIITTHTHQKKKKKKSTNFHMYLEEKSHRLKSKDSTLLYSCAIYEIIKGWELGEEIGRAHV